ncbi:potassium/proton antiporter [Helicobacter sp.]|uniref:potassium/proton antiporter n=1 Tax=Helicobacter sp. TaxID=218 RepID=UPI0025854923|nr:potassium/proton antiporter [Helicobacter sp.]MCI7047371.1 potassium/proton antiporter [Helicobacter sp.]MCI7765217.1 potassium/proton antiporter [Helicobacter sp.]MDY5616049.1 potassium/proton antiporter [Helicobacter sp.]
MVEIIENLNLYIVIIGVILFISVYASKISEKIGIPLLLMFLGIGMLLGSEGIGGIEFDNALLTQAIGTIALIFILYSGGLDTFWEEVKPVAINGILLATFGVLITALVMACFIYLILDFTFLESMLLGSIVSSTDAAAVFMILRSQKIRLKNNIRPLLELESGSNDPMAIFLTIIVLQILTMPQANAVSEWFFYFVIQFVIGGVLGLVCGYLFPKICQFINISQAGLYPLISVAWLFMIFGLSSLLGGNGFLSIYIAGIMTNKFAFPNKAHIIAFHDVIAWMMQIVVFLVLGLLVFPSELPEIAIQALILSLVLIFIARPMSVFISLMKSKYSTKEKAYISWVGLRGAVPIILATYPYAYKLENSHMIFNVVFFMVLVSVLLQGVTIGFMAKRLGIIEE